MGFKKFLKKAGKAVKKGLSGAAGLAVASGLGPGALAPVILSKVQTMGENRRKKILKAKAVDSARASLEKIGAPEVKYDPRKSPAPPSRLRPAGTIDIKLGHDIALGGVQTRQKAAKAKRASLAKTVEKMGEVDKKVSKLSASQRALLADEFKAKNPKGTPAQFRAFLAENL